MPKEPGVLLVFCMVPFVNIPDYRENSGFSLCLIHKKITANWLSHQTLRNVPDYRLTFLFFVILFGYVIFGNVSKTGLTVLDRKRIIILNGF